MKTYTKCALFCTSAVVVGATTYPSSASASFSSTHAGTNCFPYAGAPESSFTRYMGGLYNETTSNQSVVCSAPDDARITLSSTLVTVSGTDPSATDAPAAILCNVFWDGGGGACASAVIPPASNVGPYTLFLFDLSPWHGTGSRQWDYPVVFAGLTPANAGGKLFGITVYYPD